jgi:UDP:flavonoid glycosyltransferase YjiC (YdhE family)
MTRSSAESARQDRPPRVLFIGEAAALSHVARPLVLAGHLARRGYEVLVARDPRYHRLFDESVFPTTDIRSLPGSIVEARLERHEPVYDADVLDRYVQDDVRLMREFKPDLVVGDFRHSLAISSQLTRIPYINIADAHWSPAADTQFELPNSPLAGAIGMPLSNFLFQAVRPFAFAYQTLPLNVIRMKYGLPPISTEVTACNTYGDYAVYPNDPALFPLKRPLPATHKFIGPVSWSPSVEKPEWWDRLPEDPPPVIYVSLGSTGRPDLLGSIFRVLERLPVTAMIATAGRWKTRTSAPNIFTAEFLPGAEAAARAKLVICNGGTMSGQQALSAGVPYLGLISNMDQLLFSSAVRRTGACEWMREGDVTESALQSTILSMVSQEVYSVAARKLASGAAELDSSERFEALVRSILEERHANCSIPQPADTDAAEEFARRQEAVV